LILKIYGNVFESEADKLSHVSSVKTATESNVSIRPEE
jgi:hypothetical protein